MKKRRTGRFEKAPPSALELLPDEVYTLHLWQAAAGAWRAKLEPLDKDGAAARYFGTLESLAKHLKTIYG